MNVYEMFETDKATEEKGVVIDYGEFQIRVARSGGANQKYNKLLEVLTKPHRKAIQTESISPEIVKKIMIEAHAKTVVLDWENVKDRDGELIPFTVENCIKLFEDLPDLFADVQEQSAKTGMFRKDALEEAVGNSSE